MEKAQDDKQTQITLQLMSPLYDEIDSMATGDEQKGRWSNTSEKQWISTERGHSHFITFPQTFKPVNADWSSDSI